MWKRDFAEARLTEEQRELVQKPLDWKGFLHGPAGAGKSTVGAGRLRHLMSAGIPGSSILIMTPQRTLQDPYLQLIRGPHVTRGSEPDTTTIGGLARRLGDLFWPIVADRGDFARPERPPHFLTLESSQYYMARIVRPLLDRGYFRTVTIERNRLYAQILDSLNKAALVGFSHREIGSRLDAAWIGDAAQHRVYEEAQDCAERFRDFCLEHGLLDFSLQVEVFWTILWPDPMVRQHLRKQYDHLIYDNVEEDGPRAHDVVRAWLPDLDSALLIYDEDAGYRRFLGADIDSGRSLQDEFGSSFSLFTSFVMSESIESLSHALEAAIRSPNAAAPGPRKRGRSPGDLVAAEYISARFYPEMLDRLAERVERLVLTEGVAAEEIAIVGPYLSDSLRFAAISRLEARGLAVRTHRPSRSLRDEPAAVALVTLAALGHPSWDIHPAGFDVVRSLMTALRTDLVRAHLLASIVYQRRFSLTTFAEINPGMQERITREVGTRYTRLREWLDDYRRGAPQPLDHFLRRLFGELLSQPTFGFHDRPDHVRVASSLIESVRQFRVAIEPYRQDADEADFDVGREYVALLTEGVLAAQYPESWKPAPSGVVLLAPAHSFIMMNRPVDFQFWLDVGSSGWFERLDQPLTHTRVLSRDWDASRKWTSAEEEKANIDGLARLTLGLLRRCRQRVCICQSQFSESGMEQRGRLSMALDQIIHESNSVESQ